MKEDLLNALNKGMTVIGLNNKTFTTFKDFLKTRHKVDQSTSYELPLELPFRNMRLYPIKKRVGRLASITWFLRVGATGFEPAT